MKNVSPEDAYVCHHKGDCQGHIGRRDLEGAHIRSLSACFGVEMGSIEDSSNGSD